MMQIYPIFTKGFRVWPVHAARLSGGVEHELITRFFTDTEYFFKVGRGVFSPHLQ
jgi:hypothetical protein